MGLSGHEKDILRKKFGHNQLSGSEMDYGRKKFGYTAKKKAIARKMGGQPLKEWQKSHFTSNPRLAKKYGIKLKED